MTLSDLDSCPAVTSFHHTRRTTASGSPVLTLAGICVLPTIIYSQDRVSTSTLTAIGLFSRRPYGLGLSPGFHPGPGDQYRLFQTRIKTYLFARYWCIQRIGGSR